LKREASEAEQDTEPKTCKEKDSNKKSEEDESKTVVEVKKRR